MEIHILFFLSLIVILSYTTEVVSGFGSTIIAVSLGALFYPIEALVPVFVPLNMVVCTYIVARYYRYIDFTLLLYRVIPSMGFGAVFGLILFHITQGKVLKIIFGILVIILACRGLRAVFTKNNIHSSMPLWKSSLWLFVGGIIHGMYVCGGPMAVYVLSSFDLDKTCFRTTLSGLWFIMNIVLMTTHLTTGKLNSENSVLCLILLPGILVGIFCGEYLHKRINERSFRIFIFCLLLLSGVALLAFS